MVPTIQARTLKQLTRTVMAACLAAAACSAGADETSQDLDALNQRIDALQQTTEEQQRVIEALLAGGDAEQSEAAKAYRDASIKRMVDAALKDANFQEANLTGALIDYDKGLRIKATNGLFESRINGAVRMRYIANSADRAPGQDESNNGIQMRSASLGVYGYAYSPKLKYALSGKYESGSNTLKIGSAYIGYQFSDHWLVRAGIFNPVFMRESVTELQGIEQSVVRELFKVDGTDAIQLQYANANRRFSFAVHDGSKQKLSDIDADKTEFAVLGRAEAAFLFGENAAMNPIDWFRAMMGEPFTGSPNWGQWSTPQGWSDCKPGVIVGAAINYEQGDRGAGTSYKDLLKYTFDFAAKGPGWNVFTAFVGERRETATGSSYLGGDRFGLVAQGGVFIEPDKVELFARYEYLDLDGIWSDTTAAADSTVSLYTLGVNWFIRKHATKFSFDVVYTPDAITSDIDNFGLLGSTGDQLVFRAQMQFKF
jgi:hypothetical protein